MQSRWSKLTTKYEGVALGIFFHRSKVHTQGYSKPLFFKSILGSFLNFWRIFWFSQISWRNFPWYRIEFFLSAIFFSFSSYITRTYLWRSGSFSRVNVFSSYPCILPPELMQAWVTLSFIKSTNYGNKLIIWEMCVWMRRN